MQELIPVESRLLVYTLEDLNEDFKDSKLIIIASQDSNYIKTPIIARLKL